MAIKKPLKVSERIALSYGDASSWTGFSRLELVDDKFIELITTSWLRESLEYDEVFRTDGNGLGDFERQERNQGADEYRLALQTALATGQTGIIEESVLAYLRPQKYLATKDTPGFRGLAFNFRLYAILWPHSCATKATNEMPSVYLVMSKSDIDIIDGAAYSAFHEETIPPNQEHQIDTREQAHQAVDRRRGPQGYDL